ncbi:MAG: hypothetical protein KBC11_00325 [Candidatus Pacebacteria bacterium]|nr:hypothetical protein [Candidatus Paceibacterota bacterium]
MKKIKTFKILSKGIIEKFSIPAEANMKYLKEKDIEICRQKIETLLSSQNWFSKDVTVIVEEIEIPHSEFNFSLFEEQNIKLLCYIGFSYSRYFKEKEIHYGCWEIYEFGDWGENKNIYYSNNGEYLKTERY